MLQLLHIENIAIIECADIEFRPGFNALTGETGAGKSIVIDSISAVLGQRTSRDLIRTGANMAFVSACFTDIPPRLGEDLGIAWEGELLLQREIHGDGKNVCRVNGRPVTVTQLRTLGSRLLNIHGQHDGQQLLDEEQHLAYLDSFGTETLGGEIVLHVDFSLSSGSEKLFCSLYFDDAGAPVYAEIAENEKIIAAAEFTNFIFGDILSPDAAQ